MTGKLSYDELERSNKQLEKEVLEYVRKQKKDKMKSIWAKGSSYDIRY